MNFVPNKFMQNHMFILELIQETHKTPWRRITMLSRGSSEEALPSAHLDPYGFKMIISVRYFLGYLQGVAFQHPMECKKKNLIWEKGSLLWKGTKVDHDGRHPHWDEWGWMESKKLVRYLQIYDTRQQEAWLRWLLLKEFGHHVTYPLSKGMWVKEVWQDTCIIGQQGVWMHCVDMTSFISIIIYSPHDVYDGGVRRQQKLLLL